MQIYPQLAQLFAYPDGRQTDAVAYLLPEFIRSGDMATDFAIVAAHFCSATLAEMQEYYIDTFDVNAACYLDIGYVLFGEESKRGQFLIYMRKEQRKAQNDCGTEFADHLPNVLTLLPKLEEDELREELVVSLVLPALRHMLNNFRTDSNIYKILIGLLIRIFENQYSQSSFEAYEINQKEIDSSNIYSCGMDFTKLSDKHH